MTSPSTQRATSQVCAIRLRRQFFGGCWQNYFNCTLSVFFVFIIDDINLHVMCNKKILQEIHKKPKKNIFNFDENFSFMFTTANQQFEADFFCYFRAFPMLYVIASPATAAVPFTAKNYCLNLPPDYLTLE